MAYYNVLCAGGGTSPSHAPLLYLVLVTPAPKFLDQPLGGWGQQALADTSCGISTGLASIIYIMNLDFGDLNVAALTPPITHNTMIHTNPLLL